MSHNHCFYCEKELHSGDLIDSYDGIYYVCKKCLNENLEDWHNKKRQWARADFGYEERG